MSYTNANITTKRCNICYSYLPISNFRKSHGYRDGRINVCDDCRNQRNREKKALMRQSKKEKNHDYEGEWLGSSAVYL